MADGASKGLGVLAVFGIATVASLATSALVGQTAARVALAGRIWFPPVKRAAAAKTDGSATKV